MAVEHAHRVRRHPLGATADGPGIGITLGAIEHILTLENAEALMHSLAGVLGAPPPAEAEARRLRALLDTPELHNFRDGVTREAAHQRERWGSARDAGKAPEDWFWLVGYLAGKALHAAKAGDADKAKHHTISTAAALANWHAAIAGADAMRPGIGPGSAAYAMAAAPP